MDGPEHRAQGKDRSRDFRYMTVLERGSPAESSLLMPLAERPRELCGRPPRQTSADVYSSSSSSSIPNFSHWAAAAAAARSISSSLQGSMTRESATSSQMYFTSYLWSV